MRFSKGNEAKLRQHCDSMKCDMGNVEHWNRPNWLQWNESRVACLRWTCGTFTCFPKTSYLHSKATAARGMRRPCDTKDQSIIITGVAIYSRWWRSLNTLPRMLIQIAIFSERKLKTFSISSVRSVRKTNVSNEITVKNISELHDPLWNCKTLPFGKVYLSAIRRHTVKICPIITLVLSSLSRTVLHDELNNPIAFELQIHEIEFSKKITTFEHKLRCRGLYDFLRKKICCLFRNLGGVQPLKIDDVPLLRKWRGSTRRSWDVVLSENFHSNTAFIRE